MSYIDFWNDDMEEGTTISETLRKASDEHARVAIRRIPEEIKQKSEEELANDMIDFVEKEGLDDVSFHEITQIYCRRKGLWYYFTVDPDIDLKRTRVEAQAQKKIEQLVLKKNKELLYSLKSKIMDKARKHNLKELTESDVELFLMESNVVLPRNLSRMLRSLANLELKK